MTVYLFSDSSFSPLNELLNLLIILKICAVIAWESKLRLFLHFFFHIKVKKFMQIKILNCLYNNIEETY